MAIRYDSPFKGRGAGSNPDNRFEQYSRERVDDGWDSLAQTEQVPGTTLEVDSSRRVISYNQSPDVPFDRSINPYRGCEHGCVYCFARPTHAWLGLSPGLDFETRLYHKPDAPEQLRRELGRRGYTPAPIALGINTDAYQPVERRLGLTRRILKVLAECRHPLTIVTKSALIERDLDLLAPLAADNLCRVAVSLTTLDSRLSRRLEPRAAAPHRRLQTIARLSAAGVPVSVLVAPLIPVLTDAELEALLEAAHEAGACDAGYVLLRLPHEVRDLFSDWLQMHEPLKAEHVLNRIRDCRGGRDYDAAFGSRMRGTGIFADLLAQRFGKAYRRLDFPGAPSLDCSRFRPPREETPQLGLFD
ncbi:radical SAM protein [Thiohalobacter thiocyanaticus]|uniref:Radical SAM protein n=1 Tax=Thiohalobacter thiocyanaticus TaxID=585455 RepID=A0A1Z4VQY7_9GAMM|nr:PA0069 family radical SAM protein [Thiohalobacter thiocyanaticus]BAZ93822.1 radical SAM protein [Thiohalobacter thiocyanaticus]